MPIVRTHRSEKVANTNDHGQRKTVKTLHTSFGCQQRNYAIVPKGDAHNDTWSELEESNVDFNSALVDQFEREAKDE